MMFSTHIFSFEKDYDSVFMCTVYRVCCCQNDLNEARLLLHVDIMHTDIMIQQRQQRKNEQKRTKRKLKKKEKYNAEQNRNEKILVGIWQEEVSNLPPSSKIHIYLPHFFLSWFFSFVIHKILTITVIGMRNEKYKYICIFLEGVESVRMLNGVILETFSVTGEDIGVFESVSVNMALSFNKHTVHCVQISTPIM